MYNEWLSSVTTPVFWYATCLTPLLVFVLFSVFQWLISENPKETWLADENVRSWQSVINHQFEEEDTGDRIVQQYSVLDLSEDFGPEIRAEIERNDRYTFLSSVLDMDDKEFLDYSARLNEISDRDELPKFVSVLENFRQFRLETPRVLFIDQVLRNLPTVEREDASELSSLTEQILELWENFQTVIGATTPTLSQNFFEEITPTDKTERSLRLLLETKQVAGYFVIPKNFGENVVDVAFVTLTDSSRNELLGLVNWYRSIASNVVRKRRLEGEGIEPMTRHLLLYQEPEIEGDLVLEVSETMDVPKEFHRLIFMGLPFVLLLALIASLGRLISNTCDEKASKLADSLLASVSTIHLLDGKLWGTAMTSLTVMLVWAVLFPFFLLFANKNFLETIAPFVDVIVQPGIVANFALFYMLLYAFYGYFLSAFTSLFSTVNNAISAFTLFILSISIVFVPIAMAVPLISTPELQNTISFFPLSTPFVMVARSGALPGLPIYVAIVVVMFISMLGVRRISSHMFARGISDEIRLSLSRRQSASRPIGKLY